jgi:Fe-S cluster assembly protein SufD
VRNNLNVHLQGEEAETVLNGFYLTRGKQHVDNHTIIEHEVPRCQSNELYKGILADQSRAVFSGLIRVHKDAQKTNAFQSNRNLLLSREAEVDTKPQLIIYADDVKCSHGATVGQMNEEAVFYMQQRGIAEQEARALLRFAFGAEVLQPISQQELRNRLEELMAERLREVDALVVE